MNQKKIKELINMQLSGEITVEASIVVPIVILMLTFILFISFYLHDTVVTKSFSYSRAIEINNINNCESIAELSEKAIDQAPLFVAKNSKGTVDKEQMVIISKYNFFIKWINEIMNNNNETVIEVENNMNTEIMYLWKAALNELD